MLLKNDVLSLINKAPSKFVVLSCERGYFGSLIYRSIVGSDDIFIWKDSFYDSLDQESLNPLEWPKKVEGFANYVIEDNSVSFKDNHLATAHISVKLLENIENVRELLSYTEKNNKLLLKTHDIEIHEKVNCKVVRIVGNLNNNIINKNGFRKNKKEIPTVTQSLVHNLDINNFISENFDIFLTEYISLISFLDINPNINNVRSFILCLLEKHKRS